MARLDGRLPEQLRPVNITRGFTGSAPGSVLYQCGATTVLCTASVDERVPPWLAGQGRGWITAEYSMLPGSTSPRSRRDRGQPDGRSVEIQRLIGRSLRAIANLEALGERSVVVDCDVLQADGGTRTAAITAGFVALVDAIHAAQEKLPGTMYPLRDSVAAISVGVVAGRATLDLNYEEDAKAEVDMNVVMTGRGQFVEVQGSGEGATFSEKQLSSLLTLGRKGIVELGEQQKEALGKTWPFR